MAWFTSDINFELRQEAIGEYMLRNVSRYSGASHSDANSFQKKHRYVKPSLCETPFPIGMHWKPVNPFQLERIAVVKRKNP